MRIEAPEGRSLPGILAPELRKALIRLSTVERARDLARRALRGLAGFVGALKANYEDIQVGLDFKPEPGLADAGDLEHDLQSLLEAAGEAAKAAGAALVLFVDELQYVAEDELAALITSLHRAGQRQLPVVLVGAGLPQLRGRTGKAKSYAERLFDFPEVGTLSPEDARAALAKPARAEGAEFEPPALSRIVEQTHGYPYFLQEWGKHVWDVAQSSPITLHDVETASAAAVVSLDESFFRVRFDRLTPSEKRYLRAMAELGPGATSVRRYRRRIGAEGHLSRSRPKQVDREGHGVEPESRRHRVHGSALRRVHAPHHAGRRLASCLTEVSQPPWTCEHRAAGRPDRASPWWPGGGPTSDRERE